MEPTIPKRDVKDKVSIAEKPVLEEERIRDVGGSIDKSALFVKERESLYPPMLKEDEKKLLRKLDFCLVPMLFFTATLGAVDKVSLSTAAIYGLKKDTHLSGQQYSWLGSILYIGSLVGMWPMSFVMQRQRLGKVLACVSTIWSILTLLHCACHNFGGLAALRFLMGFMECAIVPGCTLSITRFYLKREQGPRLSFVFAFVSSIINGFLSWLVGYFDNNIQKWKYLYIIIGSISFVWSVFIIFFLPDSPMNARFLSDKEKYHVTKRVISNSTGVETNDWKWGHVLEAFCDIKIYLIFLFNIGINIPNGGLSTFNTIIINNLGFNAMESSLMSMPTGTIATIITVLATTACTYLENWRCLVAIVNLIFPLVGSGILYGIDRNNVAAQLAGLYLLYFYFAPYVILISLAQANTAGNTKKTTAYSINYLGYCAGAIIGPQTFRSNQAPKYTGGFVAMMVAYCVCILIVCCYWVVCIRENMNKEQKPAQDIECQQEEKSPHMSEGIFDFTDKQQRAFRYTT